MKFKFGNYGFVLAVIILVLIGKLKKVILY